VQKAWSLQREHAFSERSAEGATAAEELAAMPLVSENVKINMKYGTYCDNLVWLCQQCSSHATLTWQ